MRVDGKLFETLSYHVDITITSIKSLHNHYTSTIGDPSLPLRTYSRTGAYTFSGFRDQENISTTIYLFLEGYPLNIIFFLLIRTNTLELITIATVNAPIEAAMY